MGDGREQMGSRPEIGWYFEMRNSGTMRTIRYSQPFKMQAVREVETGQSSTCAVTRKYNIKGTSTVMRWVRQYGSGKYGKIIRVEKVDEVNEAARLRSQLRQAKEALADAHMELALEKAFLGLACEQMGQTTEAFKKKHAGRRRTARWRRTPGSK
jgi:transposase-like protein